MRTAAAAHRGALEGEDVGVVDEAVADGVGEGGLAEELVPALGGDLRVDDGGGVRS
jgi:hypothetical protein